MLQSRPLCPALYAISVRRLRTLPAASFGFHLTMDTLAVRLTLPTTKRVVDFHHQAIAHGGRTTKRAARFRRVALKKLLSVFAEQPRAFLGTFISYHILSPKSTQFCPALSNFVQFCPHLSKFVQPAFKSTAPASKFPSHQEAIRFVQRSFSCCSLGYVLIQIL